MLLPNAYRAHAGDAAAYFLLNLGLSKPLPSRSSPPSVSSTYHPSSPSKLSGLISAHFSRYCKSHSSSLHFLLSEDLPGALRFVPPIRCQLPTVPALLPAACSAALPFGEGGAAFSKTATSEKLLEWSCASFTLDFLNRKMQVFFEYLCSGSSWHRISDLSHLPHVVQSKTLEPCCTGLYGILCCLEVVESCCQAARPVNN